MKSLSQKINESLNEDTTEKSISQFNNKTWPAAKTATRNKFIDDNGLSSKYYSSNWYDVYDAIQSKKNESLNEDAKAYKESRSYSEFISNKKIGDHFLVDTKTNKIVASYTSGNVPKAGQKSHMDSDHQLISRSTAKDPQPYLDQKPIDYEKKENWMNEDVNESIPTHGVVFIIELKDKKDSSEVKTLLGKNKINFKFQHPKEFYLESKDDESKARKLIKDSNIDVAKSYGGAENVDENVNESYVEVDAIEPNSPELKKLLKKYNVSLKIINKKGPSGFPEVKLTGSKKDLKLILADENGWDDESLADDIVESLNESKSVEPIQYSEIKKLYRKHFDSEPEINHGIKNKGQVWTEIDFSNDFNNKDFSKFREELVKYLKSFDSAIYDYQNDTLYTTYLNESLVTEKLSAKDLKPHKDYLVKKGDIEAYAEYKSSKDGKHYFDNSGEEIVIDDKDLGSQVTNEDVNESANFDKLISKEKFEKAYADKEFESWVSKNYEVCRIDKKYYISDIDENELQIDDRKSLKKITKDEFEKATK